MLNPGTRDGVVPDMERIRDAEPSMSEMSRKSMVIGSLVAGRWSLVGSRWLSDVDAMFSRMSIVDAMYRVPTYFIGWIWRASRSMRHS